MRELGGAIAEAIVMEFGAKELLRRLADPLWFQSFGCVLGMDWHSSGITTSVLGALKIAMEPRARELGVYICGGRGKQSRKTPEELLAVADRTGLDGNYLVRCSRLSAKIDNTAVQDGFQLYLHSFIVTREGDWAVIQQGMNDGTGMARRYHWHSPDIVSFVEEPHSCIFGENQGTILNLTDRQAAPARQGIMQISREEPGKIINEARSIVMPRRHHVTAADVDLKRLGGVLALAYDTAPDDFESLLLLQGLGPRTLQSLALVSEVIYGTPVRFTDPARFSFAHGGKDGHPAPVPLKVYDETIAVLTRAVEKAKLGRGDKQEAVKNLAKAVRSIEEAKNPEAHFNEVLRKEWREAKRYGGRTVYDDGGNVPAPTPRRTAVKKKPGDDEGQMTLF